MATAMTMTSFNIPTDADSDGYTVCTGDCNDNDAALNPEDLDGDGYSTCDDDCDDSDASVCRCCEF